MITQFLFMIILVIVMTATFPLLFLVFASHETRTSVKRKASGVLPVKSARIESKHIMLIASLYLMLSGKSARIESKPVSGTKSMTDKPYEKLARGSYFLILSNITNLGLGAAFWILLAKIVSLTSLGQTMVVIALATSVFGFAGYGVSVMVSKYIADYNVRGMPNTSRRVFSLGLKIAMLVSSVAAIILALLSGTISSAVYHDPSLSFLMTFAVVTYLPSQTIVAALTAAFQGSHRMEYTLLINLIYEIARLAITVMLVLYGLSSFGILVGFSAASLVASLIGYVYLIPKAVPWSKNKEEPSESLRHTVKFSGLNYFAIGMRTLSTQIGVLIVGTQSIEWAALYGISVLIANMVGGILLAVSRAILPTASEEWTKGNQTRVRSVFNTAVRISLFMSGFSFLILMIEPSYVLRLISESYIHAALALRILVVSAIISSLSAIMISLLNATNRAKDVALNGLISSAITIALTFVLPFMFGIDGAAIAILSGSITSLVLSLVVLKRRDGLTLSLKNVVKPLVSISVGLLVGFPIFALWHNIVLSLALSILSYIAFSWMCRVTTESELRAMLSIVLHMSKRN